MPDETKQPRMMTLGQMVAEGRKFTISPEQTAAAGAAIFKGIRDAGRAFDAAQEADRDGK